MKTSKPELIKNQLGYLGISQSLGSLFPTRFQKEGTSEGESRNLVILYIL